SARGCFSSLHRRLVPLGKRRTASFDSPADRENAGSLRADGRRIARSSFSEHSAANSREDFTGRHDGPCRAPNGRTIKILGTPNFSLALLRAKRQSASMPKTKKKTSKRKPNPAFMRPVQPDDKLAAIVGSQPLPRSELTKKLWNYIKKHGCQDKKKRTMINADDSLRPVFNGKSQVSMFEMTKLVSGHLR